MPSFKILSSKDEIGRLFPEDDWVDAAKFNSKDRIVGENGKPLSSQYNGRVYRLIAKKERTFSTGERVGRGFLGVIAAVCSLGFALLFKTVRSLFTQNKEKVRIATVIAPREIQKAYLEYIYVLKKNGKLGMYALSLANAAGWQTVEYKEDLPNFRDGIYSPFLAEGVTGSHETVRQ